MVIAEFLAIVGAGLFPLAVLGAVTGLGKLVDHLRQRRQRRGD